MIVHWPVSSRGRGWAVVQLYDPADDLSVIDIDRDLSQHFEGLFLFPALRHWRLDAEHAMNTYGFVMKTAPDPEIRRLKRSRFTQDLLANPDGSLCRVTDKELSAIMRESPVTICPGTEAEVTFGDWAGMRGKVLLVNGSRALVRIHLHSRVKELYVALDELRPV